MRADFISDYQGCADFRVQGYSDRCSVRYLKACAQSFYKTSTDPQLLGTVIIGAGHAPEEVIAYFNIWLNRMRSALRETKATYVDHLITVKWYPHLGWIRCESDMNPNQSRHKADSQSGPPRSGCGAFCNEMPIWRIL